MIGFLTSAKKRFEETINRVRIHHRHIHSSLLHDAEFERVDVNVDSTTIRIHNIISRNKQCMSFPPLFWCFNQLDALCNHNLQFWHEASSFEGVDSWLYRSQYFTRTYFIASEGRGGGMDFDRIWIRSVKTDGMTLSISLGMLWILAVRQSAHHPGYYPTLPSLRYTQIDVFMCAHVCLCVRAHTGSEREKEKRERDRGIGREMIMRKNTFNILNILFWVWNTKYDDYLRIISGYLYY